MTQVITEEEKQLEKALEDEGIEVVPQYNDGFKRVDLRVRQAKVDIEVDGLHHLLNPVQINKDLNRSYHSQMDGYATLHVPNREIRGHLKKIAHAIAVALKYRIRRMRFKSVKRPNVFHE